MVVPCTAHGCLQAEKPHDAYRNANACYAHSSRDAMRQSCHVRCSDTTNGPIICADTLIQSLCTIRICEVSGFHLMLPKIREIKIAVQTARCRETRLTSATSSATAFCMFYCNYITLSAIRMNQLDFIFDFFVCEFYASAKSNEIDWNHKCHVDGSIHWIYSVLSEWGRHVIGLCVFDKHKFILILFSLI